MKIPANNHKVLFLQALSRAPQKIHSSSALVEELGISRQAVSKIAGALRTEGVGVESVPQKGYRLASPPDRDVLSPAWAEFLLRDCPWGHPILYWKELDSTQSPLKELARAGVPEGAVAVAETQTQGRGRRGRTWSSPPTSGLYFSVLMRPRLQPHEVPLLSFCAGLAIVKAARTFGVDARLKWPNDVVVRDKKLCGILSECASEPGHVQFVVTGIGVNLNMRTRDFPADLRDRVASMYDELGSTVPRSPFLALAVRALHGVVKDTESSGGVSRLIDRYRATCSTIGRDVRVMAEGEDLSGKAVDVDANGALIVETGGKRHSFAAADVVHLR